MVQQGPETGVRGVRIACRPGMLSEIRHHVVDAFWRLPHGGLEVGGVLFGTLEDGVVRIEQQRPIPCQYAQGPTFRLSDTDQKDLSELLLDWTTDPELRGLKAVGWYRSRTRSALRFDEQDTAFGVRFFPGGEPVALVVHPTVAGTAPCAWFIRDADGVFGPVGQGEAPSLEVADRTPRETTAPKPRKRAASDAPVLHPAPVPNPTPVLHAAEQAVTVEAVAALAPSIAPESPTVLPTPDTIVGAEPDVPPKRRRRIPRVVIRVKLPLLGSMAVAVVVFAMILLLVLLPPMAAK